MQIIAQKPRTKNQEMFILNVSRIFEIKIVDEFSEKYKDQVVFVSDNSVLGHSSKNNISRSKVVNIENIPKLSTIGLYKKGEFNPLLKCKYGYLSYYPVAGREYILNNLYNYSLDNLRVIGPYGINIPNYIGSCSFNDAMDFAVSSDLILDFDTDMVYELLLNDCNVCQLGKQITNKTKQQIIEDHNYLIFLKNQLGGGMQDKIESFLNEEIRNLR